MTDQRMIGEILSERRRSLGLSIDRVIADTKLQRRMVEAFEMSDFDAMPPKGYAQASLASYARYLGLNPNEVLRVYDEQLYEFQYETSMGAQGLRDRGFRPSEEFVNRDGGPVSSRGRSASYSAHDRFARGEAGYQQPRRASRRIQDGPESTYREDSYDAGRPQARGYASGRSRGGNGSGYVRSVDRGLYDSGYRRSPRTEPAADPYYATDQRSYGYERDPYPVDQRDPRMSRGDYDAQRPRSVRDRRERGRGEVQMVMLDDGYQGGSGGLGLERYRAQQRQQQPAQRQSVSEVVLGLVDSVRSDPKTMSMIIICLLCALLVAVIVAISSCARGGDPNDGSNIPVTPVSAQQGAASTSKSSSTPLADSVDLDKIPLNSVLSIVVNQDASISPWIEVRVDDVAQAAHIKEAGSSLQYTVTKNAYVLVSDAQAVVITVNGTQVTPTLENNSYVLRLAVDPAQISAPLDAAVAV